MKSILAIFAVLHLTLITHSQNQFVQLTNPSHNQGYICWVPITNARSYTVEFFDLSKPDQILNQFTTENSYYQVDPAIFYVPNLAYRVRALDNSGNEIFTSNPVPNTVVIGDVDEYETVCEKECNGRTYAYKFVGEAKRHYTNVWDNATSSYTYYLENLRIHTTDGFEYYNEEAGVMIPFFQAIEQGVWDSISSSHPYKLYNYSKIPLPLNHQGIYKDANNNVVQSGVLIEKKFDQFAPFAEVWTNQWADAGTNVCSANVAGPGNTWLTFFNTYHDTVILDTVNAFVPYPITQLDCLGAWEDIDSDGEASGATEAVEHNFREWMNDLVQDAAKEHHDLNTTFGSNGTLTWGEIIYAFADIANSKSTDGDYVTNIIFDNLIEIGKTANLYRTTQDDFILDENTTNLPSGLYRVTFLTSNSKVIPYYMDINKSTPAPLEKDFSTLVVAPNPVQNRDLVFNISGSAGTNGTYYVHDLMGNPIAHSSFTISESGKIVISKDLSSYTISNNFVILSIIFEDGSVLQKSVEFEHE